MSLWLIGSAGVWAGVWFHGSTSRHYCADSGSKRISTAQTLTPNYVIYSRWQRLYCDDLPSLFYSGRKQRRVVQLFYSLWFNLDSFFLFISQVTVLCTGAPSIYSTTACCFARQDWRCTKDRGGMILQWSLFCRSNRNKVFFYLQFQGLYLSDLPSVFQKPWKSMMKDVICILILFLLRIKSKLWLWRSPTTSMF